MARTRDAAGGIERLASAVVGAVAQGSRHPSLDTSESPSYIDVKCRRELFVYNSTELDKKTSWVGGKMDFDVFGPFEIGRKQLKFAKMITKASISNLWDDLEYASLGLSEACGCYVFGIRAGKGIRPHYAGQALKSAILSEAFNSSNILKYNQALLDQGAGTPMLFVLPLLTKGGKYRKPSKVDSNPILDFLEDWLIAQTLQRNPKAINNKKTKFLRRLHVTGVFNAVHGESTWDSGKFNAMMKKKK